MPAVELVVPKHAAIDLTLMFGAESYIRYGDDDDGGDPWRHDAFRRFVNVVLSGAKVQYPLPNEPDTELRILGSTLANSVSFTQVAYSSAPLNAETEVQVVEGFSGFLREAEKRRQLGLWLRFQLSPGRVDPKTHKDRREPITADAGEAWLPYRKHFLTLAGNFKALPKAHEIEKTFKIVPAESPEEFALLYAFDIYRRGWQYAHFASERDAKYFPHMFRSDCLDQKGDAWQIIERMDLLEFSWAKYFLTLVSSEPFYRNAQRIVDLLKRVLEAQRAHPIVPWPHLYLEKLTTGDVLTSEEEDHIVDTLHRLYQIAQTANLPLLPTKAHASVTSKAAIAGGIEAGKKVLEKAVEKTSGYLTGLDLVTSVVEEIPAAKVWIEQQKAKAVNAVFRGSYNYTGLLPKHVSSFYELFRPTY